MNGSNPTLITFGPMLRYLPLLFCLLLMLGCGTGATSSVAASTAAPVTTTTPVSTPTPAPVPAPTPSPAVSTCVTFIGDSLTDWWPMAEFTGDDGKCYVDHGIAGTTLAQILDGIDDHSLPRDASVDPSTSRIVVIGGDVWNSLVNAGQTVDEMETTYTQILVKLQALGVQPVICTNLPSYRPDVNSQVVEFDRWLRATAAAKNIPLADDYAVAPLVMPDGTLNPANTPDGIHLTPPSYDLLTATVETAIAQARAKL